MSKLIPLSRGLFATVDDADFEWLSQWKWSASRQGKKNCAAPKWRAVRMEDAKPILMHRQITDASKVQKVDHWDRNPLNNQRANLRVCTQKQNTLNAQPHADSGSKFKGVCFHKGGRKWMATFRDKYLGLYATEIEAARAYDEAAAVYDPEFCLTNFHDDGSPRDFQEPIVIAEARVPYSLHKGVHWHKNHGKWGARAHKIHLGYFQTEEEALSARDDFLKDPFERAPRANSSIQKGVTWNKRQKRWVVQVKGRHVGTFLDEDGAIEVARSALREYE